MIARVKAFLLPIVGGVLAASALTASPLTIAAIPVAWLALRRCGRGLPADERRVLMMVLWGALGARLAVILGLFLAGIPGHSDISVGGLTGDDAYYLSRAIRGRDVMAGFASGGYDYFVITDAYGQTNYLRLLTWVQAIAGPTPYGMRVWNALMFVVGGALLFRTVRRGFGAVPAFIGLVALLFLPSLFVWSISLLKESLFFLVTSALLAAVAHLARQKLTPAVLPLAAVIATCFWLLDDLRRGGFLLAAAGIGVALVARAVLANAARLTIAVALAGALVVAGLSSDRVRSQVVGLVTAAAGVHAGHVYTVGHAYKLLDDGFYARVATPPALTEPQAARFVARALASFALTPLPWEMASLGELAFMPEHLLWYATLIFLPIGFAAAWQRDPFLACLLAGYALPTAVALAVTNGNVGTLLRLRGLVAPQLIWLGAMGAAAAMAVVINRRHPAPATFATRERPTS